MAEITSDASCVVCSSQPCEIYRIYRTTLERIGSMIPKGHLLDIGCSYRAFVEPARNSGWEATGVDISRKATSYARQHRI